MDEDEFVFDIDYLNEKDIMSSRYLCDVLDDMRKMYETRNFSGLMGSIEQAQVMAHRMEAGLRDNKTLEEYEASAAAANRALKSLRKDANKIEVDIREKKVEVKELELELRQLRHALKKESKGGTLAVPCCERNADNMACDCPNK